MNLYELTDAYQKILTESFVMNEETGEIIFDESNLNELKSNIEDKIDNITCYIKNIDALNDAIANEVKTLTERKKANERKIESLKQYVVKNLDVIGKDKITTPRNQLSFRKSVSVEINDEESFCNHYINSEFVKTKYSADKTLLKKAINDGLTFDGVCLKENKNLQIK